MVAMCAVGDNVIDRYPEEQLMFPGGSAANAAVFARRLGIPSSYIGILGDDLGAAFIQRSLVEEGVDVGRVKWHREPSATTDVVVDAEGNRTFIDYSPPQNALVLSDDDLEFLQSVDWIQTGHSSFIEPQLERMQGTAPISFDFSKRDLDYAAAILPRVAVATFSREELSADEAIALLGAARELGAQLALVTRGAEGAIALGAEGLVHQAATPAAIIDTIGAGDAFQTSLISGMTRGKSLADAMADASVFAAEVCTYRGAFGRGAPLSQLAGPVSTDGAASGVSI